MQEGVTYPTVSSMSGASARSSAVNAQTGANTKLASLISITKGGSVVVPQVSGSYTQQNGSQGPNAQMISLAKTGGQQYQNSVYDAGALKKGGKKKNNRINKTFGKYKRFGKTMNKIKRIYSKKRYHSKKRINKK